jgi:hypothetical protein
MLLEWLKLEQRRSERCPSTDKPPIFQTETKFDFHLKIVNLVCSNKNILTLFFSILVTVKSLNLVCKYFEKCFLKKTQKRQIIVHWIVYTPNLEESMTTRYSHLPFSFHLKTLKNYNLQWKANWYTYEISVLLLVVEYSKF